MVESKEGDSPKWHQAKGIKNEGKVEDDPKERWMGDSETNNVLAFIAERRR
jgi:hypothetical protein